LEEHGIALREKDADEEEMSRRRVNAALQCARCGAVGIVNVVTIDPMLHDRVKQTEGRDEGTREGVSHRDGEDAEIPGVMIAVFEALVETNVVNFVALGRRSRRQQPEAVKHQIREANQLQRRAHEGRRDHVVDEERSVVWEENAAPTTSNIPGICKEQYKGFRRSEGERRKNEQHDDEVGEAFDHDSMVEGGLGPVTLEISHIINEDGFKGGKDQQDQRRDKLRKESSDGRGNVEQLLIL